MRRISRTVAAAFALAASAAALGQQPLAASSAQAIARRPVITHHHGVFNGTAIRFTATVEETPTLSNVRPPATTPSVANIVSFAYTRNGVDPARRPVMFLFNGGPIVASLYVHIGGLGPWRVSFPDDVHADPASFKLIENSFSPLDAVDLVFVDPASTGFSRVTSGTRPEDYHSIPADAAQFAAFIRTWLDTHGRSNSPVYLFGESYGTNRAATIAGQLTQGDAPLPLAGLFLYGQALNIIEYAQRPDNIVSYVASLPTIAAIGYYHRRVDRNGRSLERFIADAQSFAETGYLAALYKGDALSVAERDTVAHRLEEFSGIPAEWYVQNRLRMTKERYRVELLKDRHLLLGRNDARYSAPLTAAGGAPDPSDVLPKAIERLWPNYLRERLGVRWSDAYIAQAEVAGLDAWGWGFGTSPFGDWPYQQGVSRMMSLNPRMRVVVANGIYDTQTAMGAAEYLVRQAGWDRSRTTLRFYDGGHMGYSVAATAKAIGDDIRAMVQ